MSYSLEDFCGDARDILAAENNRQGRDKIRGKLEQLLVDPEFQAQYLQSDNEAGLEQIYEDPDYGFCVLIYNMDEPRVSPPHDHGRSWAIYGQAAEFTDMTVWRRKDGGSDDKADLEKVETFRLNPGQAGLYDVGDIHSIDYPAKAKFVRVTGVDMSKETRLVFDADSGDITKIEHVGTG